MSQPNYDVSELKLTVNASGWVLGVSRLGVSTRLRAGGDDVLTISEVSAISLSWETTVEEEVYVLPSISRMTVSTPAPEAKDLPTRADVQLLYRDELLWAGTLRSLTSSPVKRNGRPTVWITTLQVDGPEQALEGKTGTLNASETFDGVVDLMEQPGIAFTRVGSSDASARCLAVHLPPHTQMSQSKLAFVRMFAKQTSTGLVGYNYHTGGWELRHAEDAILFPPDVLQASDGTLSRVPETGRLHFMPSRGASEEDPPDFVVFPESDPDPLGATAGYYHGSGVEQTDVSPLTTTYTFPQHLAGLPLTQRDQNAVTELLVPFSEELFDTGALFNPLPWRGPVDFEDGEGYRDVCILSVTHEISPEGWLLRMQTTRGAILDRYAETGITPAIPGGIRDINVWSPMAGMVQVEWAPTAIGHTQNPKVLVAITHGDVGALNPFWVGRDLAMGGVVAWVIADRADGVVAWGGLPPGVYSGQVWHLSKAGESLLHSTDTTVPGLVDGAGHRYSVGGHSRTRNTTVA